MRIALVTGCTAIWLLGGCGGDEPAPELEPGSPLTCSVLRFAREADVAELSSVIDSETAAQLDSARAQGWIQDLEALETIVGADALAPMARYVESEPQYTCGTVEVQLLGTNDFHGNLKPPAGRNGRIVTGADPDVDFVDAGGAEYLATHIQSLSEQAMYSVVVAAGDIVGATPLISALFHDEPTIESMNQLGLDIAGVGNHEFDEGADELLRLQMGGCHPEDGCADGDDFAGAAFSFLAANVIDLASNAPLLPPYEIRAFRGARVAFIGMTLEGTPQVTAGAGGLTFRDEADTVNALIPEIRAQGVEAVVVLLHEGGYTTGLYNACEGISGPVFDIVERMDSAVDVVVTGHTNAAHICDVDGTLVTSAASAGRLVTDIDLSIDELTGKVVTKQARNVIVTRDVAKDADQTKLIEKYDDLAAPLANRVIGAISETLSREASPAGESVLGNLIADAQLAATAPVDRGAAVVAFMNPGGIRSDLSSDQISGEEQPGEVTYEEMFTVQPFGNILVSMTLTGAQIHELLEQQWSMDESGAVRQRVLSVSEGFTYRWDPTGAVGDRVDPANIQLDGEVISADTAYRVTVNNFLAGGGDGFSVLTEGTDVAGGFVDLDAFVIYLTDNSPIDPPALGRIQLVE